MPTQPEETIRLDEEGFYINSNNEICTNQQTAALLLNVDEDTLKARMKKYLPDAWSAPGRTAENIRAKIGKLADFQFAVHDLASVEISIKSNEFYTVGSGKQKSHYGTTYKLANHLGVSVVTITNRLKGVRKLTARVNGSVETIYRLEDFLKMPDIIQMRNPPIELDEEGYYIDPETGDKWCSIETYWGSLTDEEKEGTSKAAVYRRMKDAKCESKETVSKMRKPGTKIYRVKDIEKVGMARKNAEVKVDKRTGIYTDQAGKRYASICSWEREKNLTRNALRKGLKLSTKYSRFEDLPKIKGVGIRGAEEDLFEESGIDEVLSYITNHPNKVINGICLETREGISRILHSVQRIMTYVPIKHSDNIKRGMERSGYQPIEGIDQSSGEEMDLYAEEDAKKVFAVQIRTVVPTDENGEGRDQFDEPLLTIERFLATIDNTLNRKLFEKELAALKAKTHTRRDIRTNVIVSTLYRMRDLLMAQKMLMQKREESVQQLAV